MIYYQDDDTNGDPNAAVYWILVERSTIHTSSILLGAYFYDIKEYY
jgi:hypothetical protein